MSLENFKNRIIEWDTVNKNFDQYVQIVSGDVNSRTLTIVITDNGEPINLTGYSVKLVYKYIYSDNSGFVMLTPTEPQIGEFSLTIPTEMTIPGSIKSNLILLNENLEQVIVSKNLKFISDDSTVTDLAQEVNSKIDDFTKLLLENMPQVMRSELDGLHAQTESNTSNIELKANSSDMTSLQSAMNSLQNKVEAFGITPENLVTIKSLLDAIANNATDSEVAELINSVNVLTSNISLMSGGDYSPKANQTELESLQSAVNTQSATISTKANKTDLDNLQTTVTSQGIAISTKAEQAEIIQARGGQSSLDVRLDGLDAKYTDLENETTAQLADKVGGGVKAEPEDLSATTLGLVTGTGGPINLMSIPQDYSVTPEKTTFIQLSENRDRFLDKRIKLNTYINPVTGVESYHETFAVSEFIAVEPLTSYIFWWDDTKNIAGVQSKVYYDENKVFISGEYGGNPITTPANCAFMRIEINKATSFDNLIMQKGSTKSENIPNPKLKDIDVDINSDNLPIGIDNLTFISEPVNKDIFLDKKIYLNTYINPTVGTPSNHATFASSEYIEVEPETTYRFSRLDGTTGGFGGVVFYDKNKNYIDGQYSGSPFTSPAGCRYVRVSVNNATTFDDVILQEGEEPSLPINDKITTAFKTDEGYFNKKWAVVGDSITEKNFRSKIHYHDYIRSELGLIVENMGVSGSGYKAREGENVAFYQRVSNIPTDVDFITIMGGVNDVLTSQPIGEVTDSTADTVCGCINKTIDNVYVTHPLAQIGLITPVPGADYNPANTNNGLALLSEKIIEIAKLRGLPSLDLYHSSGLRPWNSVVNKALFSTTESPAGDGLHPNDQGHKFFYRKIMEFVKTL